MSELDARAASKCNFHPSALSRRRNDYSWPILFVLSFPRLYPPSGFFPPPSSPFHSTRVTISSICLPDWLRSRRQIISILRWNPVFGVAKCITARIARDASSNLSVCRRWLRDDESRDASRKYMYVHARARVASSHRSETCLFFFHPIDFFTLSALRDGSCAWRNRTKFAKYVREPKRAGRNYRSVEREIKRKREKEKEKWKERESRSEKEKRKQKNTSDWLPLHLERSRAVWLINALLSVSCSRCVRGQGNEGKRKGGKGHDGWKADRRVCVR